ncbi:MAG: putative sodium/proton antiporter [Frankiales bacterium]|nr:putative sodium/proton antiporter [Frankiales bacterium]
MREFLRTETLGAVVLVAATVLALAWVAIDRSSYQTVWATQVSIRVGDDGVTQDLQQWVNNGLMTFFFLVVGLEARREFDLGDLRDRRRLVLPVAAAVGGMLLPIGIYLLMNAGHSSARGWGTAMSTDTAFALGILALVGRKFPSSLRTFILTIAVADDLVAFAVLATAYTRTVRITALLAGLGILVLVLVARSRGVRNGFVYSGLGLAAWIAIQKSGVNPVLVGVVMGLASMAYPAARVDLERASDKFRVFREEPTSAYAQTAREGVRTAISPNERLQQLYHPLSSYLIVPVFALANAGIPIDGKFLSDAFTSPITLGILLAYVVGKPAGIAGAIWLVTRLSRGRVRPPIGWGSVLAGGSSAAIGFTVSLLIATLAFNGLDLQEAKLGVLSAGLCAFALTWVVLRAITLLPERLKLRAVVGNPQTLVDLAVPVDEHDHVRGPDDAPVTLVEYGDFECPNCGRAEPVVRDLLADFGDLRYVWRHLPLTDVHPHAQLAAEAAEFAAKHGKFWEMHDLLMAHQTALEARDLLHYGQELGLDVERLRDVLRKRTFAARVAKDIESADLSGVSGTPTFFINGRRHYGAYDIATLSAEVRAASARAALAARPAATGRRQ